MKKNFLTAAVLIYICLCENAYSGEGFRPWGANIRIGDENIILFTKIIDTGVKEKESEAHERKAYKIRSIYNGLQGGAYFLIKFFQIVISPQDGPNCRFAPTCSAYGREAVEKHGALLGGFMAGERLLRCNPYTHPGIDRVPGKVFGN